MANVFARLMALVLLIGLSPAMLAIYLMVILDSRGPGIFVHSRFGKDDVRFNIYKFRTMIAIDKKDHIPHDALITRAGRFLRKYKLDEIPQLVNVLNGSMGFIGPRPEHPDYYLWCCKEIQGYSERTCVKPGITGLAQLCLGYTDDLAGARIKLKYDRYYIENMGLAIDLKIIIATLSLLLFGDRLFILGDVIKKIQG